MLSRASEENEGVLPTKHAKRCEYFRASFFRLSCRSRVSWAGILMLLFVTSASSMVRTVSAFSA